MLAFSLRSILPPAPLSNSSFSLDASGVAGFFGADEALSAMIAVHVYQGRKWLGWYNSPGSYLIAKKYQHLAKSRFKHGLFPGVSTDPSTLFELGVSKGPKFEGVESGSIYPETTHLSALIERESRLMEGIEVSGRKTLPIGVTIVDLNHIPEAMTTPTLFKKCTTLFALIPISVSIATCIMCALVQDWYSFSMILLGIIAGGVSCFVLGSGEFTFYHPIPPPRAPQGNGLFFSDDNVVILLGEEGAVNSVTRGNFSLHYGNESQYKSIAICAWLFTAQFVAQLLLIPQGTLFGQIMFVTSLAVSWAYNCWLSSHDKEEIQTRLLLDVVLQQPRVTKYMLGTRTAMAVFVLLALESSHSAKLLDDILPNNTEVWQTWKSIVLNRLKEREFKDLTSADLDGKAFGNKDQELLRTLLGDAWAAHEGYSQHMKMYVDQAPSAC